jgi:hypothetical protein
MEVGPLVESCLQTKEEGWKFVRWGPPNDVQEQPQKPGTQLLDIVPVQPEWRDGYLLPPAAPGLGVEFDREAAKAHPFRMAELPHLRREDGGFTNW